MTRLILLLLIFIAAGTRASADDTKAHALLVIDKVWKVELRLTDNDWKAMQPKGGGPPGFGRPGAQPANFKFNYDFPYVRGSVAFEDETLNDVGVRFKGNGTYMMSASAVKRPFRLDFNRFTQGAEFRGLKAMSLSNNVMDTTRVREAAGYDVFRAAGVPAPRTTFVELSLHVPGKYEHQLLGVYTAAEPIDKAFLKRHFKNGNGMLLKPEKLPNGLEYLGEVWTPYSERYGPKVEPTDVQKQRLIAFAKLLNTADDETFKKEIENYLDIDLFLRFLAAVSYLAHYDSFIGLGHNYVVYLNPETNKFSFLPWDLDHAFGGFFPFGQPGQLADASIMHPHGGDNKLIDRLLAIPAMKSRYLTTFKKLNKTAFEAGRVSKVIATCEAAVKDAVARETKANPRPGGGFGPGFGGTPMSLAEFVQLRAKSIAGQLAGEKPGFVPRSFGGGFGQQPLKQPDPAKCADICKTCATTCESCAKQAADREACAKLCISCSRACLLCAELCQAKSSLAGDACSLCERLCVDCATLCSFFDGVHFQECEKACRDCAKACANARK